MTSLRIKDGNFHKSLPTEAVKDVLAWNFIDDTIEVSLFNLQEPEKPRSRGASARDIVMHTFSGLLEPRLASIEAKVAKKVRI